MSPEREEAEGLLKRAAEDATAVAKFAGDRDLADAVVGFHAQQAVEKALKAVLAAAGVEIPRTHDIRFVIELLEAAGISVPEEVREGRTTTRWAVEFRYGDPLDEELDRSAAIAIVGRVTAWASGQLSGGPDQARREA